MASDPIRVVVADDHAIVREGIRTVLEQAEDIEVVAEADNGTEALQATVQHEPDVLLLDISMPELSGLEVATRLRASGPHTRVLILSVYDDADYVLEAVRAGAHGYLRKDSPPAELRAAIRAVHAGGEFFSAQVAGQLSAALRDEAERKSDQGRLALLTEREQDVLRLIASGRTNKEAAAELGISHRTVETHREHLMKKLDAHSMAELVKFALKSGVIPE